MSRYSKSHDSITKLIFTLLFALISSAAFAAQESTIFTFDGENFVRDSTTLMTADGKSAVNTTLNRDDASYHALMQKRSYIGDTTINGIDYHSYYAPLVDDDGQLTGAIFVGNAK